MKPREWWLVFTRNEEFVFDSPPNEDLDSICVIEKSAYDQLENYAEAMDAQWYEHATCNYERKYREVLKQRDAALARAERAEESMALNVKLLNEQIEAKRECRAKLAIATEALGAQGCSDEVYAHRCREALAALEGRGSDV